MSCKDRVVETRKMKCPVSEVLTGADATAVQMANPVCCAEDFATWIVWLKLNDPAAVPDPANFPTALRILGYAHDPANPPGPDPVVPCVIKEKCLDGKTWGPGCSMMSLEIDSSDIGGALGNTAKDCQFTCIGVEIEGPAGIEYMATLQGCHAFASSERYACPVVDLVV